MTSEIFSHSIYFLWKEWKLKIACLYVAKIHRVKSGVRVQMMKTRERVRESEKED